MAEIFNVEAALVRVGELVRSKDFFAAKPDAKELVQREPQEPEAWYHSAVIAGAKLDLGQAEEVVPSPKTEPGLGGSRFLTKAAPRF